MGVILLKKVSKNNKLKITNDIESLNLAPLGDNIYHYQYKTKSLLSMINKGIDKESSSYIALYNTFVGALYENIIYEHLLIYAKTNDFISKFILKGPHQNDSRNIKNGFLIDTKSQIVFKSGYKDISEFDAMFFSVDSVYFVEMTVVKSTADLRKRLKKKRSLLKLLFPKLDIKCLVVVTKEALATHLFPDFCVVWITDTLDIYPILKNIKNKTYEKKQLQISHNNKMINIYDIDTSNFKYYSTLKWILYKISNKNIKRQAEFLKSKNIEDYYNIYSKIFIAYIIKEDFEKLYENKKSKLKDILNQKFADDKIYVAVEKTYQDDYKIVYYIKLEKKLKKIEPHINGFKISDKQPKGFTFSEIKFLQHLFNEKNKITIQNTKLFKELL
ncbi:MAG: hypothetical protein DRG11_03425 [Epsilonproteobacteria bacterium]|nr:MAG: hypothetical protein DRG11_03425 [Campylobacterota bacterium]